MGYQRLLNMIAILGFQKTLFFRFYAGGGTGESKRKLLFALPN